MSIISQDYFYKIALVGDSSVGKSCLLKRFSDDHFQQSYHSTIGVDFKFKTIEIDRKFVKLQIWDTAGQQRFRTIASAYYKNAQGIIITFDASNLSTLASLQSYWLQQVRKYGQQGVRTILIGNKADLPPSQPADPLIQQFSARHPELQIFLCSARTGEQVQEAFCQLTKLCIDHFGSMDQQIADQYHFLDEIRHKKSEFQLKSGIDLRKSLRKKGCC